VSEVAAEQGRLDEQPLPVLLLSLYRQRANATLRLRRDAVEKRVFLRDGVPVMAESNLPSESLGIQLLDAGRITREDYARVVELVKKKRCKEGAALLALELVAPRELFEALKLQVRRRLLDCMGWSSGSFAIEPGVVAVEDASAFRCDPVPLIQEGVAIHWSGTRVRAALGANLDRYPGATARTASVAQRLHQDADVERLLAGIGGREPLGALLDGAPTPALAAALVLDGVGALSFRESPPADADAPEAEGLEIEVVVAGSGARDVSTDAPRPNASAAAASTGDSPQAAKLREEIGALHARLAEQNHYELLGLARDAEAGAIRRAYVGAAKRFHPDAVARMGLADLRAKAEAVFARIAEAHEVLGDPARRRDYDVALDGGGEELDTARLVQAESLYRKAEILLRAGNFGGALEFLRPCVALWSEDATYQSSLGWALYKRQPSDPKTAREHLEKAIALDANDAISHFRLGMVLRALGDEEDAATMLAKAKRLDPKVKS
jgi:tetratricopeptide (TPR) repeat protein